MYVFFLTLHSGLRWAVLLAAIYVAVSSAHGWLSNRNYNKIDRIAAGINQGLSHLQVLIGALLYFGLSPVTRYFMDNGSDGLDQIFFFGLYHIGMMFLSVIVLTVGGALAKRAESSRLKFKTLFIYNAVSVGLILAAIPWFRPLFRL